VLCDGPVIEPENLCFEQSSAPVMPAASPPAMAVTVPEAVSAATPAAAALAGQLQLTEQQIIIDALRGSNGSRLRVAERLGISPRTLRYKLARMRAAGVQLQQLAGHAA
jgi:two-component system, response regulator FlrC